MNIATITEEFETNGFAVVRGLFAPQRVAELEQALQAFVRDVVPDMPPGRVYYESSNAGVVKSIHGMNDPDPFFRDLLVQPRLLEILYAIWPGGDVVGESVMFFGKAAGDGSAAPAHQDNAFQCWDPPLALTATIAIDASTPENGALTCLRGSHRAGLLPHRQSGVMGFSRTLVDEPDTATYPPVQLCMRPGDLALHHVNTIHLSGPNRSASSRRQLGLSYHSSRAAVDQAAFDDYQQKLQALHASAAAVIR
jgi:ectoine hydroxylase-related dioxygenase (phytanoyl-CoA dioxygenase family)